MASAPLPRRTSFSANGSARCSRLAVADLRAVCRESGKDVQFRSSRSTTWRKPNGPAMRNWPRRHGIAVTQVTNYLAWARRELRRLLLERLQTVTSGDRESRAELRTLFGAP